MSWMLTLLVVAGAAALARIYYGLRKMKEKTEKDWDARVIERLRAAGSDPFQPHDVDFFMAMPSTETNTGRSNDPPGRTFGEVALPAFDAGERSARYGAVWEDDATI